MGRRHASLQLVESVAGRRRGRGGDSLGSARAASRSDAGTGSATSASARPAGREASGCEAARGEAGAPSSEVGTSRGRAGGRGAGGSQIVPFTLELQSTARQLIISGPNTGGKTVTLKATALCALMAQSGIPVPAEEAKLPLFTSVYADIGDAQSIEAELSTFSAHIVNLNRLSRLADPHSLVLLDELGSATDPEEGSALAVAVAAHFLAARAWTLT